MKAYNFEQGTPEWRACRAGKVTASGVKQVLAQIKSGEAASRRDYRVQIVTEILTGEPVEEGFTSKEMAWGHEQEPFARAAYEVQEDVMVDQVGFVDHPTVNRAGTSPDGLIGWDGEGDPVGLLEIKCPKSATHLGYILDGRVPTEYQPQMLWQMACTGAKWVDFVSFDPRMPEHLQLFVRRFDRDENRIKAITDEVLTFLGEVQQVLGRLQPEPTPDQPGQNTGPAPALERRTDHGGASPEEVPI